MPYRSVQGWSSFIPVFSPLDFVTYYIELPVMLVLYTYWLFTHRTSRTAQDVNIATDMAFRGTPAKKDSWFDFVDISSVDLAQDEYESTASDGEEDALREARVNGKLRWAWRSYYLFA